MLQAQLTDKNGIYIDVQPNTSYAVVVPSDTEDNVPNCAIYVGVAGHINMLLENDTIPRLFKNVPVGILRLSVRRILASSTAATDIVPIKMV